MRFVENETTNDYHVVANSHRSRASVRPGAGAGVIRLHTGGVDRLGMFCSQRSRPALRMKCGDYSSRDWSPDAQDRQCPAGAGTSPRTHSRRRSNVPSFAASGLGPRHAGPSGRGRHVRRMDVLFRNTRSCPMQKRRSCSSVLRPCSILRMNVSLYKWIERYNLSRIERLRNRTAYEGPIAPSRPNTCVRGRGRSTRHVSI